MKLPKRVYEFAILLGLIAAVGIYGFGFDYFSETELVQLSYLWIAALAFGAHGLIASELSEIIEAGQAETTSEALGVRGKNKNRSLFSKFSTLLLPSFLLITAPTNLRNPILIAVLATVIWLMLLVFFFEGIFPGL